MSLLEIIAAILILIALLSSYRVFIGPTVYDRLIALNVVVVVVVVIFTVISVDWGIGYFLDITISFLLLNFLATLAFIRYLEGGDFH